MIKWSLFIDIQGFSELYKSGHGKALSLLSRLAGDLYIIGNEIYSQSPKRLFIYQIGDGFVICPYFGDPDLVRPISIAIAIMRSIVFNDGFARASISQGEMFDILSCYPQEIQNNYENGGIALGEGIMTIHPVMGDGLINAYKLANCSPQGPRLLLDNDLKSQINNESVSILEAFDSHVELDWIHSEVKEANKIFKKIKNLDWDVPCTEILKTKLTDYLNNYKGNLSDEWKKRAEIIMKGPIGTT